MSLQGIRLFEYFDSPGFLRDKRLLVTKCSDLISHETKQRIGTRVEVVIIEDNTVYPPKKDGTVLEHANAWEKLVFKVPGKELTLPFQAEIIPVNPVGVVYGDFRNQLSLTADDIQVVSKAAKNP